MASNLALQLKDFNFSDLLQSEGLQRLDETFLKFLKEKNNDLFERLLAYRQESSFTNLEISELIIAAAKILEDFLSQFFNIEEAVAIKKIQTTQHNPVSVFKKYFVLRRAKKLLSKIESLPNFFELNEWLQTELKLSPLTSEDHELSIALLGMHYLNDADHHQTSIEKLTAWCTHALTTNEAQAIVKNWTSFRIPNRLDYLNLVYDLPDNQLRHRDGFKLTDERMSARNVQDEINYCIYCHDHDGDFCSKGFPEKKGVPEKGFKKNPLDTTLTGCPLEEKISEMNFLKKDGYPIAPLTVVMIDNPMCPATGHRICNDCMKACVYQKQDPVNIPQIETHVLTDVLDLPWGVEIYDLLTRWNPLRQKQWVMKPYNGLKVMIAGMGPAGFTLAHHLLQEGMAVVGFDGLKIEPIPKHLLQHPIQNFKDLKESLDERIMTGFGGVAEYGITVRWDKNFLKLIYLSLMRRPYFQAFGGVRFGGSILVEDAWEMGFDHFVIAVGAGLPKALPIPNSMSPGMRQANDFLMSLHLGNAVKENSLSNLQIRMPAVVIGGGLTGVDTATEVQAYYIKLVEKVLSRYEILSKQHDVENFEKQFDEASRAILKEYLEHGRAVREERLKAKAENRLPNFIKLIKQWGGVTIAYRRLKNESPAYLNNHEELQKALQEGIHYAESLEPASACLDQHGHTEALICLKRIKNEEGRWESTQEEIILPARSILIATGTQSNTAYEFEHRDSFNRVNLQYLHYESENDKLALSSDIKHCKEPQFGPFTSYQKEDKRVSLIGDTHPVFHGSVVKAIASGLKTYPKILNLLKNKLNQAGDFTEYQNFKNKMSQYFHAELIHNVRKTKNVLELTIKAPFAVKHFQPGEFYRLQNFESFAPNHHDTLFLMEPLALQTAEVCKEKNYLTFIVHTHSTAGKICALLKPGDPVSLMGPTGVRAKIKENPETILIIGSELSFAFLRSYGKVLQKHHRVIFVGEFHHTDALYDQAKLESSADVILWVTKNPDKIQTNRIQDRTYSKTDAIHALLQYEKEIKSSSHESFSLQELDRIFIIGDTHLLKRFQAARQKLLKPYLIKNPKVLGSVYGNMQCMLKGVCAQCLQWQIDPATGERTKAVFACSWQDQPLEIIDLDHTEARLTQNRFMEQFNLAWIEHVFAAQTIDRV